MLVNIVAWPARSFESCVIREMVSNIRMEILSEEYSSPRDQSFFR